MQQKNLEYLFDYRLTRKKKLDKIGMERGMLREKRADLLFYRASPGKAAMGI